MDTAIFQLTDRVAIVTGGGQGIGKAIALGFADFGANVVVAEKEAANGEKTAAEIRALGRRALATAADVRDSEQVAAVVKRTVDELGRIDILVNNVGGQFMSEFLDYTEKGWDAIIRTNLKSNFVCTQAVGRVMVEQRSGCIINIASLSALAPAPSEAAYSAAKAGILNLTQYLAREWGKYNVRVVAIAPGSVRTESWEERHRHHPEVIEARSRIVPLGRLGLPEDVAKAAIFLASDAAAYITGISLIVDGGRTAGMAE